MCRRRTGRSWGFPQTPRVTLTRVTLTVVLWTACLGAAEVDGADLDGPPRGWASPGTVSPVPPAANGLLDAAPASTSSTLDRIVQGLGPLFASRPPAPGTSVGSPPGSRPPSPRAPRHALDFPPVADTPQRDRVEAGLSQIFQPPPPPAPVASTQRTRSHDTAAAAAVARSPRSAEELLRHRSPEQVLTVSTRRERAAVRVPPHQVPARGVPRPDPR